MLIGIGMVVLQCTNPQVSYGQFWMVSFDGAPALKPAQLELSVYGAGSYYTMKNESGTRGYTPGLKVGIGIAKNFDAKLSYSRGFVHYFIKLEDSKFNNISVMPKFSFLKDYLAVQLPFTLILYNEGSDDSKKLRAIYSFGPRVIFSIHHKKIMEFNISPAFEIMIAGAGGDPSYRIGGNIGFAFSSNLERWSIRPEGFINYLLPQKDFSANLIRYGWGLAFTYNINLSKKRSKAVAR